MKKKADATDWKTKYVRALADYQNLEKRVNVEKAEIRKYAAETVVQRLLPALDSLAKAKEHLQDQGLTLAYKEFEAALTDLGVTKIEVVGQEFDPREMECIDITQGKDNVVVKELLPGYRLHNKIIRVAQVTVGKGGTV